MELKDLLGRTGCIETPMAMIPFYRLSDEELILFDSGREPHPELLELLEREHLRVRAVLCTHLHEDHVANNEALIARYGTEIYASKGDIVELSSEDPVSYPILGDWIAAFGGPYGRADGLCDTGRRLLRRRCDHDRKTAGAGQDSIHG